MVAARQWVSVKRYLGTIALSFVAPVVLCLAPLIAGHDSQRWLFIVGGISLCTVLLAPPALRIDFRRDLKRMLLLRSLPVRPFAMVLGQIALPVLITCLFQWLTIAIAAFATRPGWPAVVMWTGLLNALAAFTFATENALFLAYPYHERAEGIAMMVRAKLTFLGKAIALLIGLLLLFAWASLCRFWLPEGMALPFLVIGSIAASGVSVLAALCAATWCWRRFDLSADIPPE